MQIGWITVNAAVVDRSAVTPELVAGLIAEQFPEWSAMPVRPVELNGWDNVTFRLGEELSIRLPSHDMYVAEIGKEHRWLPVLAPQLPLPIPEPVARGKPSPAFPRPWSVYRWLPGVPATPDRIGDLDSFAADLASFLAALYQADTSGGPAPGPHSFSRGGPVDTWDEQVNRALDALGGRVPVGAARDLWQAALDAGWSGPGVWVHGDVVGSNLLLMDGRLGAVIDFGCAAVGDPACDLLVAWTLFTEDVRERFRAGMPVDEATWVRGQGWTLWRALMVLQYSGDKALNHVQRMGWRWGAQEVITQLLASGR